MSLVKQTVGSGTNINAMGYNVADNLLYVANGNNLIEVTANSDSAFIGYLNTSSSAALGLNAGDVDENSQYWGTNSGNYWLQVDLKPGSATFGKVVANGTVTSPNRVIDWGRTCLAGATTSTGWATIPLCPSAPSCSASTGRHTPGQLSPTLETLPRTRLGLSTPRTTDICSAKRTTQGASTSSRSAE
jgi:hypothetical protein